MAILKKPYEISIWKDEATEGNYYKEVRIAVIGSDTMTSPNKAFSPVLTVKNNGEVTFTFSMTYKYYDPAAEVEVINPLIGYLINERKVKLYYDDKWYDFIIKNHEEDSESNIWTYTATDAFVDELSKVGYSIEFNSELGGNQGTAAELARKTLENTDWEVGESDTLIQQVKEPMYRYTVNGSFIALDTSRPESQETPVNPVTINNGEEIYVFYSYIASQNTQFVQFMRAIDEPSFTFDSNNVIIGTNYRILTPVTYTIDDQTKLVSFTIDGATVSPIVDEDDQPLYTNNQGFKLVYDQLSVYDPVMKRTVKVYEAGDKQVYSFIDSNYTTSTVVTSFVTNGNSFDVYSDGSLQGWSNATYSNISKPNTGGALSQLQELSITTYPELKVGDDLIPLDKLTEIDGYIEMKFQGTCAPNDYSNTYFNRGIMDNADIINHLAMGQELVLRLAAATSGTTQHGTLAPLNFKTGTGKIRAMIALYEEVEQTYQSEMQKIKKVDPNNIFIKFDDNFELDNTIIKDGVFDPDYKNYRIDGVVQHPSSKCVYTENGENPHIWDSINRIYIDYTSAAAQQKFINYYSSIGKVVKPLTNTFLTNPQNRIGIFFYTDTNALVNQYVYVSDIQITQCLRDKDGNVIPIGNVPTSVAVNTENFYIKPEENKTETDVELYYQLSDLAKRLGCRTDDIKPVYNEKSEKYLSIEESQSNCFNILQSICETFECWLKIDVEHNEDGSIKLDGNYKPNKKVYLKEYAGKDNFAGFKYGINLNSVQRTLNSDEIVTKLIVEQVQSEYVDEGIISIRNASANPSGESNILNFDYYLNKELITNKEIYQKNLNDYYTQMKTYNNELNQLELKQRELEAAHTELESQRNVYTEYYDAASDDYMQGLADFEEAAGVSYDTYREQGMIVTSGPGIYELAYGRYNDGGNEVDIRTVKRKVAALVNRPNILFDRFEIFRWDEGNDNISGKWSLSWYNGDATKNGLPPTSVSTAAKYKTIWNNIHIAHKGLPDHGRSYLEDAHAYDLTENDGIIEIVGQIYNAVSVFNNYSGLLTNINQAFKENEEELYGHPKYNFSVSYVQIEDTPYSHETRLVLNDYIDGFQFDVYPHDDISSVVHCESSVSNKSFEIVSNVPDKIYDRLKVTAVPTGYHLVGHTINEEITITNGVKWYQLEPDEEKLGYSDLIKQVQEEKDACEKDFFSKYGKFIKEGTWSSDDYIDPELYYLDAMQVSQTSAFPKVEYSINVAEVSELEGLENYTFAAGDKTYIEDTEFFGWAAFYVNNEDHTSTLIKPDDYDPTGTKYSVGKTPAREEVIVSEVEWHLDEPETNVITVQNYKTQFEDLFQRISATVQQVQYNEATYAKTSTILDQNGTINQSLLLASLKNIAGSTYALTSDGSIRINKEDITIQNLLKPQKQLKITNEGISFSNDGGTSWHQAITGDGIDIGAVYTGKLNTNEIVIGNDEEPSFRWDKYGISAYKNEGEDSPYDLSTFVRFDQYGLYGITDNVNFKARSLQDIKNQAYFGITWDGFFIRNSYTNGYVSISNDNDFQVIQNIDNVPVERIKIGALEFDDGGQPEKYGIRIKNKNGQPVFVTDDNGDLTITGTIDALGGNFSQLVTVGRNQSNVPYIAIDGTKAELYSSNYYDGAGYGWMINKDGDAVFNNITARGAIKTAVFEYAEIQAVGGVFLFRPSSTIKSAVVNGNDLLVTVEKPALFNEGSWCKVSNYTTDGTEPIPNEDNILGNNGLTHVYKIEVEHRYGGRIDSAQIDQAQVGDTTIIRLLDAAEMVEGSSAVTTVGEIIGGALINMGYKEGTYTIFVPLPESNPQELGLYEYDATEQIYVLTDDTEVVDGKTYYKERYENGIHNYGIGINSSDNTVNLPARAISLFETQIDETANPKVSYNFRGILGTLPQLGVNQVSSLYNQYMKNTQGIYTDNMYIGDKDQFLAFYTDTSGEEPKKKLRIKANEILFESGDGDYTDVATIADGSIQTIVYSTLGTSLMNQTNYKGALYVRVTKANGEIDPIGADGIQTTDQLPTGGSSGDTCIYLDSQARTATLYRNNEGNWGPVTLEATYEWTFRNKDGIEITDSTELQRRFGDAYDNTTGKVYGKCLYVDATSIDKKIIAEVKVIYEEN